MSNNPYQAPIHGGKPEIKKSGQELADLSSRFVGQLIDGVVMLAVTMPIALLILVPMFAAEGMGIQSLTFNIGYLVTGLVIGQVVFLAVQGFLLKTRGQTVGKLVVKTQILSNDTNEIPEFFPLYAKRYLLMAVIYSLPFVGGIVALVNALMIFRANRKCLHDEIAGTKVVKYFGN